jgi:hypothetical protein
MHLNTSLAETDQSDFEMSVQQDHAIVLAWAAVPNADFNLQLAALPPDTNIIHGLAQELYSAPKSTQHSHDPPMATPSSPRAPPL